MKHSNISIFVPHVGCPNMCSFCNQHTISGAQHAPSAQEVREICEKALGEVKSPENTEIAFFGGSFTAIRRDYMTELLESVQDYIGENKFKGIRISTRPDCIDEEILFQLKSSNVTAIELGAQSMSDKVLQANDRGHTAEDVRRASELIRQYGFELGLQMMVGLYKSLSADELATMKAITEIHPDTLRIYPVVILKGTRLAELFCSGEYNPPEFDSVAQMCAEFMEMAENSGIRIIKCGLHASEFVEQDMVGGFYHPAFRELCESTIYRRRMEEAICCETSGGLSFTFAVHPSCISKAMGHKKSNAEYFKQRGIDIKIIGDKKIPKYQCELRR